jgi:hypothetical protein
MTSLKSPTRFHSAEHREPKTHKENKIISKVNLIYSQTSIQPPPQIKISLQVLNTPTRKSSKHEQSKRQEKERGIGKIIP